MSHDFTKRIDRTGTGSEKWELMLKAKPDVTPGVCPLSVADMELENPPEIIEALQDFVKHAVLGYTNPTDDYFDAVIGWQKRRHGWTPRKEWICTSPGVVPAFFNAIKALSAPGDGIIIQSPVYYPFSFAIERTDRVVVDNPLILVGGNRYEIDFDDLESKARDSRNKVLLLCSPHNPVGRVWTAGELRHIVDICAANGVFIISDEIHDDLIMPGCEHTTIMKLMSEDEMAHCMVCTAPSKTFNLAGCQCSNIFIPSKNVRDSFVEEFEKSAISELNAFAYPACIAAYTRCDEWLDELIDLIWNNHLLVEKRLREAIPDAVVFPLEGTYLQWIDLRCLGMGPEQLESFLQQKAEIFFDEGALFGSAGSGFERMNLAAPRSVIDKALDRLESAVTSLRTS